jgi:hypothetical protein
MTLFLGASTPVGLSAFGFQLAVAERVRSKSNQKISDFAKTSCAVRDHAERRPAHLITALWAEGHEVIT